MTPIRSLVWLVALIAFVVPSFGTAAMVHAAAPAERAASVDCPDHAPPPDPCPAKGTAKHAAGACCPLMTSASALLPPIADVDGPVVLHARVPAPVRHLIGRTFTTDPPPPRV
ncbi:MAG: hypothetical protein ABJC33_13545 [Betaproteobacteria bacterium]